jgi:aspartate aminotransferase-like enzyme
MRENHGIAITGSLKELADTVVRIGHMGHVAQPIYVEMALAALERTLHDLGHPVNLGSAVGAALTVM